MSADTIQFELHLSADRTSQFDLATYLQVADTLDIVTARSDTLAITTIHSVTLEL